MRRRPHPPRNLFYQGWPQQFFSAALLACFLLQEPGLLLASRSFASGQHPPLLSFDRLQIDKVTLPKTLGTIEARRAGCLKPLNNAPENSPPPSSCPTVILIQDAHAIPDAQKNISRLLYYFQKNYGIDRIGLEGASEKLDAQIFQSFPNKALLKKVFKKYHTQGEVSGGIAAAIFHTLPAHYQGVEDWDLYEEGVELYLKALEQKTPLLKILEELWKVIEEKKQKIYSAELLGVDRMVAKFRQNDVTILEVLQKFSVFLPPEKNSELSLFLEEGLTPSGERDSKSPPVLLEIKRIAKKIKKILAVEAHDFSTKVEIKKNPTSLQRRFHQKHQQFQTSEITPEAFALFLRNLIQKYELPIPLSQGLLEATQRQSRWKHLHGTTLYQIQKIINHIGKV